jgi:preprotein translocase subunit Sec61beta
MNAEPVVTSVAPVPTTTRGTSSLGHFLAAAFAIAIILLANIFLPATSRLGAFIATIGALVLLLSVIGREIKQRPGGIIIDDRNRISLSKLQAVSWTVLIMSGLITIGAIRMGRGDATPLNIEIGPDLLIVMGISAASMVATPAILSLKTDTAPDPTEVASALRVGDVVPQGKVHTRSSADQASWVDIFRGDEVANASSPDLSKIQQFLITGLLLVYYAILLGRMCWNGIPADPVVKLPTFDESMVWLLGISHAGYLGYKAAPHSSAGPTDTLVQEVG